MKVIDYEKIKVKQIQYGCVPASIEWLIKFLELHSNLNLSNDWDINFQEITLNKGGISFNPALEIIGLRFPSLMGIFGTKVFNDPIEKISMIKHILINEKKPCLFSLANPSEDAENIDESLKKELGGRSPEEYMKLLKQERRLVEALDRQFTYHIMPIIGCTDEKVFSLDLEKDFGNQLIEVDLNTIIYRQRTIKGGNDILYIK